MIDLQRLISEILFIETGLIVFDSTGSEVDKRFAAIQSMSADRLASKLVAELGVTREERTLADGMGGVSRNHKTGETTVHSKPCTRQFRYVTEWVSE
jgi:ABC-type uncharacterized transport system ATPase subunit